MPEISSPVRNDDGSTVFVLPAAVLFQPNSPNCSTRLAAQRELDDVVAAAGAAAHTVSVVGHTADDGSGPDGGGPLSTERAEIVRDLLVEMGVPAASVTDVRGVGAAEPLVEPSDSPANRAVVTLTRTG